MHLHDEISAQLQAEGLPVLSKNHAEPVQRAFPPHLGSSGGGMGEEVKLGLGRENNETNNLLSGSLIDERAS